MAQCVQRRGGGLAFREIRERRRKTVPLPPQLVGALRKHGAGKWQIDLLSQFLPEGDEKHQLERVA